MLSRPMTSKSISHDIQAQHEHVSSSFSQSRELFANGSFCPILFKITLRILRQISTRLRLNSEFWAEGSSLGFHVATCKTGVFTHQYSSVWEIRIFNTIGRSLPVMVTKRAGQIRCNRWSDRMDKTAQVECKRVGTWSEISHIGSNVRWI